MGSGSAIRSIYGGFVHWLAGTCSDTSIAKQIVDHTYWPEMRVVVLVVNDKEKETGSTLGMQNSVKTSTLIAHRAAVVVPERIGAITAAILNKDFHAFAELTMRDSNQFHAIAQDTWPPIRYMNDTSWQVVRLVHSYNEYYNTNKVAYTFDAGPNACLYLLQDVVPELFALVSRYFPNEGDVSGGYVRGRKAPEPVALSSELINFLDAKGNAVRPNSFKYVINTTIGDGPQVADANESLLDVDGNPK